MKLLLFVTLLIVSLALGEATRCRSSDECGADECCVSKGFFGFRKGECKKRGQIGDKCSEEHEAHGFLDQQYDYHCPCVSGLICEPETRDSWFGTIKTNPKCVTDISRTTPAEKTEQPTAQPETTSEPETPAEPETPHETDAPQETEAPVEV